MAMELGTKDDTFYVLEEEDYMKLVGIQKALHAGNDKERDLGHRLWLVLSDCHKFKGIDLYTI